MIFTTVCTTIWFGAGALTAFLLYGQFLLSESIALLLFASAYEMGAIFAIPYLVSYPGIIFSDASPLPDLQITGALRAMWLIVFTIVVSAGFLLDPNLQRRITTRLNVRRWFAIALVGSAALAILLVALLWIFRGSIPTIVVDAKPTNFYHFILAPTVLFCSITAFGIALIRGRGQTYLSVWMAVVTMSAALDAVVNGLSLHVYSLEWTLAKIQTTLTMTIVLFALLVEIASIYLRSAHLSTHDALTGVYNRRGFDELAGGIVHYAMRKRIGIAMLVVDIDHFKKYNDHFGHTAGDDALKHVAKVLLEQTVRRSDFVARIGGEEFAVVLTDVNAQGATRTAERLQQAVAAANISHPTVESRRLTISIGISQTDDVSPMTALALFKSADSALYQAKASGRERYVLATPS